MSRREQSAWAARVAAALASSGVSRVVVSPGSRSAPLALALEARGDLELRVIVDERCAAFYALGQARLTGKPSALLCTSGSAAGHYLPAVIEAAHAGIPLIVLTADRPVELHHRDAPQTIEQRGLFGAFVKLSAELGSACCWRGSEVEETVAWAVHLAGARKPGPVQLNLRLRKPLEPESIQPVAEPAPPPRFGAGRCAPDPGTLEMLAQELSASRRGLILAGPVPVSAAGRPSLVARLGQLTGLPLIAESTSQLRFVATEPSAPRCDAGPWLQRAGWFSGERAPDLLLQLGGSETPSGRSTLANLAGGARRWVITPWGWQDPLPGGAGVLQADLDLSLAALIDALGDQAGADARKAWCEELTQADATVWGAIDHALAAGASGGLPEGAAVRESIARLPDGGVLMLGNSLPVREADLFCPSVLARPSAVLHQKGAQGIDGLLAGALGAASCSQTPVMLLLGDLALQHDIGALLAAGDLPVPLVVVVLNNGGGRLFDLLPLARRDELAREHRRLCLVDQRRSLAPMVRGFGVEATEVRGLADLARALTRALGQPGLRVIEAIVDPDGAKQIDTAQQSVHEALGGR